MPGFGYLAALLAATVAQASPLTSTWSQAGPDTGTVMTATAPAPTPMELLPSGMPAGGAGAKVARQAGFEWASTPAALVPVMLVLTTPAVERVPGGSTSGMILPARVGPVAVDTPPPPPPTLVDYSDAYYTRLQIHKWASWAMLPLFAAQYASGQKLMTDGYLAPGWARAIHGPAAAGVAGLFAVNTVTGVWSLWEGRKDPNGRKWRTAHGLLMLAADAGFVATGVLASDAGENGSVRSTHKQVAMVSMGVAITSWLMMLPPFRRD